MQFVLGKNVSKVADTNAKSVESDQDFCSNISTKSEDKLLSSTCLLILQIKQPLPVLIQSYLSEECPRGRTGSGSSPSGAQPELIVSQ